MLSFGSLFFKLWLGGGSAQLGDPDGILQIKTFMIGQSRWPHSVTPMGGETRLRSVARTGKLIRFMLRSNFVSSVAVTTTDAVFVLIVHRFDSARLCNDIVGFVNGDSGNRLEIAVVSRQHPNSPIPHT